MKVEYFDMGFIGVNVGVCFDAQAYGREMARMGVVDPLPFVVAKAPATCHWFGDTARGQTSIICLDMAWAQGMAPLQVAAILVHEAVHAYQHCREWMREETPSTEFEAYLIQYIAQRCFEAYVEQIWPRQASARRAAA